MPYIRPSRRPDFDRHIDNLNPLNEGDLNYVITRLIVNYTKRGVAGGTLREVPLSRLKGLRYSDLNAVVGVLESAKAEYQRRVVAPFEDAKIKENGDCY